MFFFFNLVRVSTYCNYLHSSLMIVTLLLLIEYIIHVKFARFVSLFTKSRSSTIRSHVDRCVFFNLRMLFAFNPACEPIFTYVFVSGTICSVGFSNDGGFVVSVDFGSGQNVVAFDAVSSWIISF